MSENSPAQSEADRAAATSEAAQLDAGTSDSALLEEALQDALTAHAAGLLAAPFGVDVVALARARRRAALADQRRQSKQSGESGPNSD